MAKRLTVLVVVLAFLGGGLAVVSLMGSDDTEIVPREARTLRKLPLGAGGTAEAATLGARRDASSGAPAHDMAFPAPVGMDVIVRGTLPDLGGTAAAYEL